MAEEQKDDGWRERIVTTETLVRALVESFDAFKISTNKSISKLHENAESRGNFARSQVVAVFGVVVTIMLPVFGLIWFAISDIQGDVSQLRDFRVEDAYKHGLTQGRVEAIRGRVDRIEATQDK